MQFFIIFMHFAKEDELKNIVNILKKLKLKYKLHDREVDLIKSFSYEYILNYACVNQNVIDAKKDFDKCMSNVYSKKL